MAKRCTLKEKGKLQEEFVNVYSHTWGSSAGLSTKRIKAMSCRELRMSIESHKRFSELKRR